MQEKIVFANNFTKNSEFIQKQVGLRLAQPRPHPMTPHTPVSTILHAHNTRLTIIGNLANRNESGILGRFNNAATLILKYFIWNLSIRRNKTADSIVRHLLFNTTESRPTLSICRQQWFYRNVGNPQR